MRHRLSPVLSLLLFASVPGAAQEEQEGRNQGRPMPTIGTPAPGSGPNAPATPFRRRSELDLAMERHSRSLPPPSPRRPAAAPRVERVDHYPGTRIVIPCGWDRAILMPDQAFWGRRDLMADIQVMARQGFIPATPVPGDVLELKDVADRPAGWKAYAIAVPPQGQVTVRVSHTKTGWFRLIMSNKWSDREEGMLRPVGEPMFGMLQRTYTNPSKSAKGVYVIVDDPGWWSSKDDPYTVTFERSWDPATVDLSGVKLATGIWGATPSVSAEFRRPTLVGVGH
jgi:hypothetical protein